MTELDSNPESLTSELSQRDAGRGQWKVMGTQNIGESWLCQLSAGFWNDIDRTTDKRKMNKHMIVSHQKSLIWQLKWILEINE